MRKKLLARLVYSTAIARNTPFSPAPIEPLSEPLFSSLSPFQGETPTPNLHTQTPQPHRSTGSLTINCNRLGDHKLKMGAGLTAHSYVASYPLFSSLITCLPLSSMNRDRLTEKEIIFLMMPVYYSQ
jgi:hypothetical protein